MIYHSQMRTPTMDELRAQTLALVEGALRFNNVCTDDGVAAAALTAAYHAARWAGMKGEALTLRGYILDRCKVPA